MSAAAGAGSPAGYPFLHAPATRSQLLHRGLRRGQRVVHGDARNRPRRTGSSRGRQAPLRGEGHGHGPCLQEEQRSAGGTRDPRGRGVSPGGSRSRRLSPGMVKGASPWIGKGQGPPARPVIGGYSGVSPE